MNTIFRSHNSHSHNDPGQSLPLCLPISLFDLATLTVTMGTFCYAVVLILQPGFCVFLFASSNTLPEHP